MNKSFLLYLVCKVYLLYVAVDTGRSLVNIIKWIKWFLNHFRFITNEKCSSSASKLSGTSFHFQFGGWFKRQEKSVVIIQVSSVKRFDRWTFRIKTSGWSDGRTNWLAARNSLNSKMGGKEGNVEGQDAERAWAHTLEYFVSETFPSTRNTW